jgi:hypothetical protein
MEGGLMTQLEWARVVAENPEGHPRQDVERALSVLRERLAEVEGAWDDAPADEPDFPRCEACPFCRSARSWVATNDMGRMSVRQLRGPRSSYAGG